MLKSLLLGKLRLPLVVCAFLPGLARAQIESATLLTAHPERYGRVDFVVMLTAPWENPYRSSEVMLALELTAPSGRRLSVPGYYESGSSGKPSVWHATYAPGESGAFRGEFVLAVGGKAAPAAPVAFTVAPSGRKGFLHGAGPWVFRFDDGEAFRGIGENLCWEARSSDDSRYFKELHENPRFNYEYLLGRLSENGGNFFRTWMCPWNLPLEWHHVVDTARYKDDEHPFNASAIQRMDELVALAESADVYFMLTLDSHGALLGKSWALSSYNAANGGPAAAPAQFFTDPAARAQYRDRLRYLVARWGWSPHIAVWELFNEIDNAMYGQAPERIPDRVVVEWHAEMSAYLKGIDPYGRLVTTSISHRDVAGLNQVAGIDFNQKHIYRNTLSIPETIRRYVRAEGKPYVIGEYGYEWDWSKDFNQFAPEMDRDFKLGLWLGLFSPTPILPMSWWWEFFDERQMTPYLARVRAMGDRMLKAGGGEFAQVQCRWSGPALPVYAVRCSRTLFVLVVNPSKAEASGELQLGPEPAGARSLRIYDTEKDRFGGSSAIGASQDPAVALKIGPGRCVIAVAEPRSP